MKDVATLLLSKVESLNMPDCVERRVISLLCYVQLKEINAEHVQIQDDCVEKDVIYLKENMPKEEERRFNRVFDHIALKEYREATSLLSAILKDIRPFDVQEMLRLINLSDQAIGSIAGKDIILLFGDTGSGKSTTIHFLAGSKMEKVILEGVNHIAPVIIKNPALEAVTTTNSSKSETRYITAVTVDLADLSEFETDTITLCDTPGFGDTSGCEVDVANSVGIVKAVRACKSVRPLVVVGYRSLGNRLQYLRPLLHVIVGMVPNMEDHISSFTYLFTRFPKEEKNQVHQMLLKYFREQSNEPQTDLAYSIFFKDMLKKTRGGANVIDPVSDNPIDLIDKIQRTSAIRYPQEVFKFSITAQSAAAIRDQMNKNQINIIAACENGRFDYILYRLTEMKQLYDAVQQDFIKSTLDECIDCITKSVNSRYNATKAVLNETLSRDNTLGEYEINQYQQGLKILEQIELLKEILGEEIPNCAALIQNLVDQCNKIYSSLEQLSLSDKNLCVCLDNLRLLSESFDETKVYYGKAKEHIGAKFDQLAVSARDALVKNNFEQYANDLRSIIEGASSIRQHVDYEQIRIGYNEQIAYFPIYINECFVMKAFDLAEKPKLNEEQLKQADDILMSLQECLPLHSQVGTEVIKSCVDKFVQSIEEAFDKIHSAISNALKGENTANAFSFAKGQMEQITVLMNLETSSSRLMKKYYGIIEILCGFLQTAVRSSEKELEKLEVVDTTTDSTPQSPQTPTVDYNSMANHLLVIREADWLEEYRQGVYSNSIKDLESLLLDHFIELEELIDTTGLDLNDYNNLARTSNMLMRLRSKAMKKLLRSLPNADQACEKIHESFCHKVYSVLKIIEDRYTAKTMGRLNPADRETVMNMEHTCEQTEFIQTYSLKPYDNRYKFFHPQTAEKQLLYIETCCRISCLKLRAKETEAIFHQFMSDYVVYIEQGILNSFDYIVNADDQISSFQNVAMLSNCLKQFKYLQEKHPKLFAFFNPETMNDFLQKLLNQWLTLDGELQNALNKKAYNELSSKIKIAKHLVVCDSYMDKSFENLYTKYQDLQTKHLNTLEQHIIDLVRQQNYSSLAITLSSLTGNDQPSINAYTQARHTLQNLITNLVNDTVTKTIMLSDDLSLSSVREIVSLLMNIDSALMTVSVHFENGDLKQELREEVNRILSIIHEKVSRFLNRTSNLIEATDFEGANKQVQAVLATRDILGRYCPEEISKRITELENKIASSYKSIVDEYSNLSVGQYRSQPPREIIEKLIDMKRLQTARTIEEGIRKRVREAIEKAKKKTGQESTALKRLGAIIKSTLPKNLQEALQIEIDQAKEDIDHHLDVISEEINRALLTDNITVLKTHMGGPSNPVVQRSLRQSVIEKITSAHIRVIDSLTRLETLQSTPPQDILVELKRIWQDIQLIDNYTTLGEALPEVNSMFEKAKDEFTRLVDGVKKKFAKLTSDEGCVSDSIVSQMERNFALLHGIQSVYNEDQAHHGGKLSTSVFSQNFSQSLEQLYQSMWNALLRWNKKSEEAIIKKDILLIKHSLIQMKIWERYRVQLAEKLHITQQNIPKSYNSSVSQLVSMIKEYQHDIITLELLNDETRRSEQTREAFYENLFQRLTFIKKVKELRTFIDEKDVDLTSLEHQCIEALRKQCEQLYSSTLRIVEKKGDLRRDEYDSINHAYNNLLAFKKYITSSFKIQTGEDTLKEKIKSRVEEIVSSIESDVANAEFVAEKLIILQEMADSILSFKEYISNFIGHSLDTYRVHGDGASAIATLGAILNRDKKGIGQVIIAERSCFKGYSISLFNSRTKQQDIKYVLRKLEGDGIKIDTDKLLTRFEEFDKLYKDLVERHLDRNNGKVTELISNLKLELSKIRRDSLEWDATIKDSIPIIMAYIFALWTLNNSQHYFENIHASNKKSYLLSPHAAQVISIFRMLGIGDVAEDVRGVLSWFVFGRNQNTNRIINNMVQIGTGEGKSVTLAVTSCILALLGYDVMCACYSDYLSKRDHKDFAPMFDVLGLSDHIHYGTFNSLCEKVINEEGNVRELVEICTRNQQVIAPQSNTVIRSKALLIDEVDVFFNKSFYGNLYVPSVSLKHDTITALVNVIWEGQQRWKQIKTKRAFQEIVATKEYQECKKIHVGWEFLIEEGIKDMLADLNTFESPHYFVQNDKIGYKEQDGISFNITYGYKTMFAYYNEKSKGTITEASLKQNIAIGVSCGEFSYAEIPLQFDCIMGVTGTLKTLSDPEKDIVKNRYKIVKHTYSPSVFGDNNLKFSPERDINITTEDHYLTTLANEVEGRLQGITQGTKRAVLVFFETKQRLEEFFKSRHFSTHKDQALIITEELTPVEKEAAVRRATTSGQITLLTRVFGRGTDFICRDEIVRSNSGVHVIQTFLSEELSEETQIKGRTARQGDLGSYSMVLLDKDLEKFSILDQEITEMRNRGNYYDVLDRKRKEYFKKQYSNNDNHVQVLKQKHEDTKNFVQSIFRNETQKVKEFLQERNKGTPLDNLSRTIVLMDATGSMTYLLQNAKNTVGIMFERAAEVLRIHGIEPNMFELQFAVYRNYNAPEDGILQCSPWESKPDKLRSFMQTVQPEYGMGSEAIEIGMWHANQENKNGEVSQIILIGDAPANSSAEVQSKRGHRGENYWRRTKFSQATHLDAELKTLKDQGIKVHAFYVAPYAKSNFESIAASTGGRCEFLDINSKSGAELLTHLVTEEVLRNVGGDSRGNQLVEAYRKRYTS